MKKFLLLLPALLLSGAAAVRGEKRTVGATPYWVADYNSLTYHGAGAPMNWDAFTDPKYGTAGRKFIPSGTAVSVSAGKIVPADGTLDTLLMISNANQANPSDSPSGYGLVVSGSVYESQLPDSTGVPAQLAGPVRAKATRFYLQP